MANKLVHLPSIAVPEKLHELIRQYAFNQKVSVSEAVRELVLKSPEIKGLAEQQSVDPETLVVTSWGGNRRNGERSEA